MKRFAWILLACPVLLLFLLTGCTGKETKPVINEVVTSNGISYISETLGTPDYIELYNPTKQNIDLTGYILTDREDGFDLDDMLPEMTLPAGGYVLIPAGSSAQTDDFCLSFGLSRSGDTVILLDPSGQVVSKVTVPALEKDTSWARRTDGTYGYCLVPTPGAENTYEITDEAAQRGNADAGAAGNGTLVLTEVMSADTEDGAFGGSDWIELYNPGNEAVSLQGLYLTDDETVPRKAALPVGTLEPGAYVAIPCERNAQTDGTIGMGISSDGEKLFLFDASGDIVDAVEVPAMLKGQSYARDTDGSFGYCGSPTAGSANDDASIGAEPLVTGGSPVLKLNEALFTNTYSVIDANGDHSDFAELYNAGTDAVSLAGCYLSDDFADPMKWALPERELAPGEYLLIFLSGSETKDVNGELHAPFAVSKEDDGLMLYRREDRTAQQIPWSDVIGDNVSMGLDADGGILYYAYPTPGYQNASSVSDPQELSAYPCDGIYISEVSASGDWVELHNGGTETADVSGWQLTDNEEKTGESLSGSLEPGGYKVITLKAFSVSVSGETLLLYDGNGCIRDAFDTGDQQGGYTSGRTGEPTAVRVFFEKATKGKENTSAVLSGRASAPVLSDLTLYHDGEFLLTITCADADAVIRYTLDGSEPTEKSKAYSEPISITADTVVQAKAYRDGCMSSAVVTGTYLIGESHTLPIVSIACDPGVWSSFTRVKTPGTAKETAAVITYYEADGTLGTSFAAGIKPRGNTSIKYPQKSLSIHLRSSYGQQTVTYPFWGGDGGKEYASLILRNGSQDYTKARLRDSFALNAVHMAGLNVDGAMTRPVVVYVNGVYYGLMDLNEGMNQDYLVTHYGVDKSTISHVSTNTAIRYGTDSDFQRVRKFARNHDFSSDAVLEEFNTMVDVDGVTDYLIAQTFFGNYDVHNQSYWATSDYTVRWRPVYYDIDRCFTDRAANYNLFEEYFNK